jgi:hypothetical protein
MSEEKRQEAFVARWSRLKQQNAQEEAEAKQMPAAEARPVPAPAAPLPALEDLKSDSDFKPFMDPQVDAGTRRSALKKLFTDAHFSAIDPFEPYSIDLTGEDPIPEEMLKNLNHAKRLLFDEPEKVVDAQAQAEAEDPAPPQTQETDLKNDVGKQDA